MGKVTDSVHLLIHNELFVIAESRGSSKLMPGCFTYGACRKWVRLDVTAFRMMDKADLRWSAGTTERSTSITERKICKML